MAIHTVNAGSPVGYGDLDVIRDYVVTASSAWGESTPAQITMDKPKASDYDSIRTVAENVFWAEVDRHATGNVINLDLSHTRSTKLQAADINILGGNAVIKNVTRLTSGLVTFISGITPCSCDGGQCYSCPCNTQCSCNSECDAPCEEECPDDPLCPCQGDPPPCSCQSYVCAMDIC